MHNSLEEITTTLDETTIDAVVNDIFVKCDPDSTGVVSASKLINFIEPFINDNLNAFVEFKKLLDPDEKNPSLDLKAVSTVMSEWCLKIKQSVFNESFSNISHANGSRRVLFGDSKCESDQLDLSNMSQLNENDTSGIANKTFFEEKIKDLLHQYRKVQLELDGARMQQNSAEEITEKLHNQIKELNNDIKTKKGVIKELQKEREDCDELKETLIKERKDKMQLQKLLDKTNKDVLVFRKDFENLEKEKQTLEEKYQRLMSDHKEELKLITELETIIQVKETENESLDNKLINLRGEMVQLKETLSHVTEINEQLKTQKLTLEKCLRKSFNKTANSSPLSFIPEMNSGSPRNPESFDTTTNLSNTTFELQHSFTAEDIQWHMDIVNFDNSACETLDREIQQAPAICNSNIYDEYKEKMKILEEENEMLKIKLNKIEIENFPKTENNETKITYITHLQFDSLNYLDLEEKYKKAIATIEDLELENNMQYFETLITNQMDELPQFPVVTKCNNKNLVTEKKTTFAKLEIQKARLMEKLENAETNLTNERNKAKLCTDEISRLKDDLLRSEKTNLTIRKQLDLCEKNVEVLTSQLAAMIGYKKALEMTQDELNQKLNFKENEIVRTKSENNELQNIIKLHDNNKNSHDEITNTRKIWKLLLSLILLLILIFIISKLFVNANQCSNRLFTLGINEIWNFIYKIERLPGGPPM